jgi:serine/threonine protein kinase
LAAAVGSLHAKEYVVGDLNESNVLVTSSALVTLIDVDSFQVTARPAGQPPRVYRCPVGKVEYTAPELQGKDFASIDRSAEHDRFALGVLIFQLLMDGNHPFRGRWLPAGAPPELPAKIASGYFPYRKQRRGKIVPPLGAPPLEALHPGVAKLIRRCFVDGHKDPRRRPTAEEWRDALERAAAAGVRSTPTVAPPRPLPRLPKVRGRPRQGPPRSAPPRPAPIQPPRPAPIPRPPRRRDGGPRWLRRTLAICAVSALVWLGVSLSGGDFDLLSRETRSTVPIVFGTDDETPTPPSKPRVILEIVCCTDNNISVAVRREPGWHINHQGAEFVVDGTQVLLLDDPRMVAGEAWYRVRVLSSGHEGWVADSQVRAPIQAR